MNKISLLFLLMAACMSFLANADENTNRTLRKDRVWYFDFSVNLWGQHTALYEIKVSYECDSIVDDKSYMVFVIEYGDEQIPLLLREENDKIYRWFEVVNAYPEEPKCNQEFLLYDFSENGETNYVTGLDFQNIGTWDETVLGNIEIVNRELIDVKGEQLVQLSAKSTMDKYHQPYEFKIVEGIGARESSLLGYLLMGSFSPNGSFHAVGFNRLEDTEGNLIFNAADIGFAGVETIGTDRRETDGRMFDLMGREIRNPQPGTLYIRDGRKHIAR